MSSIAQRRARVARVRRVQHLQAVGNAAEAEGRLVQLETSDQRLAGLRNSLVSESQTNGATLGSLGELSARLDDARVGLGRQLVSAKQAVDLRLAERLTANIAREGAERLQDRAVAEMHKMIEQRMAASFRPGLVKGGPRG
ncbi:hypothetical protein FHS31_003217 [Sphingomonas vulcanisoli]|uniref:Flagellar FliJ protein n=1 Tax=Sphingomonas vulcanisoli TaxID=1658060 RepID=A0ABX0U0Q3_9SPHN|nr:hypothetical protein [Sphingomonas vulcanisoli]NIJ09580.1 hypothetical protein [Sphingomonas vulcanisoli]